jgi:hypothetical protein
VPAFVYGVIVTLIAPYELWFSNHISPIPTLSGESRNGLADTRILILPCMLESLCGHAPLSNGFLICAGASPPSGRVDISPLGEGLLGPITRRKGSAGLASRPLEVAYFDNP